MNTTSVEVDGIRLETVVEKRRLVCRAWRVGTDDAPCAIELRLGEQSDANLLAFIETIEFTLYSLLRPRRRPRRW